MQLRSVGLMLTAGCVIRHLEAQTLTPLRAHFQVSPTLGRSARIASIKDSFVVSLFADGGIKSAFTVDEGTENAAASGVIGFSRQTWKSNLTLLLNITGISDTVRQTHASTLLYPTSGTSISTGRPSVLFDYRTLLSTSSIGVHFYASTAPTVWEAFSGTDSSRAMTTNVYAAGVLGTLSLIDDEVVPGTHLAAFFDAGFCVRTLGGQITLSDNETARRSILRAGDKTFKGVEFGITIVVNTVRVGWAGYLYQGDIPGLSNGESIFSASVSGPLISGRKHKPPQ